MSFKKRCFKITFNIGILRYFTCNRSGEFVPVDDLDRNREAKYKGSCKTCTCPAEIILSRVTTTESTRFKVTFHETHVGHECDPAFLRINDEIRERIAQKVKDKVDTRATVNAEINDASPTKSKFRRGNLITRQDIRNASAIEDVHPERLDDNDPDSIDLWVQKMRQTKEVLVIAYKKQGEIDSEHPDLSENDFILAFCTQHQLNTLKRITNREKNIICMDATHGLSPCGFPFVTVMTRYFNHQGFPFAHAYVSHENRKVVGIFLSKLR